MLKHDPMEIKLFDLAKKLGECLRERKWYCAVAESCTGGKLAAAITDIAGSSQWFDRGFVTYTNQAKMDLLGVSPAILAADGAVSEATVRAMAEGAMAASEAQLTVAITGIAGPGGGSADKPVGLVWFAWAGLGIATQAKSYHLEGERSAVRAEAVAIALEGLITQCISLKENNNVR